MRLYCIRHGQAESSVLDNKRHLTDEGKMEIHAVGKFLAMQKISIVDLLHSPKLRAQETAEVLMTYVHPKTMKATAVLSHEACVDTLAEHVRNWKQSTLLVTHMPLIASLVNTLLFRETLVWPVIDFQPGTITCLHRRRSQWIVEWVVGPKDIAFLNKL
jgi:phosphohistidine phosphatase